MEEENQEEDQDHALQMKYDMFLRWLQLNEKSNISDIPLILLEETDNFQDTVENEEEEIDDNVFLESEEPLQDEQVDVRKEEIKLEEKETNIFLNFSLNRRPSVLEILGIPEDDPKFENHGKIDSTIKPKPISHNKGKAPEPPPPPLLPKRQPGIFQTQSSASPSNSPIPEKSKPKRGRFKGYLPSLFTKSDGSDPSSASSSDFGRETQI